MAHHRIAHPTDVEGCFGCKTLGVGWQGLQSAAGGRRSDPVQRVPVVADAGARRGQTVGAHAVHWDGRQDATVRAPKVAARLNVSEE